MDSHGIRVGGVVDRQDEFELANGSSWLCRGVGAAIQGLPVDLVMAEDPYGSQDDYRSEVYRQKVVDSWEEDVVGRIQPGGAAVLTHTRWGPADLIGRRLEQEPEQWRYLAMPALAGPDHPTVAEGETLYPGRFSTADFLSKKSAMADPAAWESLYMCNPLPRGGVLFRREWFGEPVDRVPDGPVERVRYWDTAGGTSDSSCYTAGVLGAKMGPTVYVEHVVRGRWAPSDRNAVIEDTAKADKGRPGFRKTYFEHGAGDSGIESARALISRLAGYPVESDRVTGNKEERATPFADQARIGNVRLVAGPWVNAWLTEMLQFPRGRWKDQVDSSSGCFNKLVEPQPYFTVATVRY